MIISFIFNEKFSLCHFFQGTRTGLGKTVSPWALALRDPHCLRLEDFLAAQMGKEAVVTDHWPLTTGQARTGPRV